MHFRLSANGDLSRGYTSQCDAYSDAIRGAAQDTTRFRNLPHRTAWARKPYTLDSVISHIERSVPEIQTQPVP